MDSVFCPGLLLYINFALENFNNREVELLCKFPVAVIVGRYSHNCTCSVRNQNVICNPDWNEFSVYRVYCIASAEYTGFIFCKVCTFKIRLLCSFFLIFLYSLCLLRSCDCRNDFVFRRNNHVSCTKQSITASCVNCKLIICRLSVFIGYCEYNFGTCRFSNPVVLHCLYTFRPIKFIKVVIQAVCIFSNFQNPQRSHLPSLTSSFARPVIQEGHQLIGVCAS